jgi:hypothetical protein
MISPGFWSDRGPDRCFAAAYPRRRVSQRGAIVAMRGILLRTIPDNFDPAALTAAGARDYHFLSGEPAADIKSVQGNTIIE